MEVIKYLNTHVNSGIPFQDALDNLKAEFGIKHSNNPNYPYLFVLNYSQIDSPKLHDYTKECRSLVVEYSTLEERFRVVSRSFDRFFNLHETDKTCDIPSCVAYEKIDGSLVSVFYYKGEWLYRTKSMIMPELEINDTGLLWKELIESTIPLNSLTLLPANTYIFEVVSPENRVVTKYEERGAYLLGIRENRSGDYIEVSESTRDILKGCGVQLPKRFKFSSEKDIEEFVNGLPDLQEGVVIYEDNVPILKVKSGAYLVAHRLRGETVINSKRIMDLIFMNEQDEFLAIFPEYTEKFEKYEINLINLLDDCLGLWEDYGDIENQKDFALKVKDFPVCGILFNKRKFGDKKSILDCFYMLSDKNKYALVENYCEY